MMYERLQSLVSYASYQKATDVQTGGTCCLCCEKSTEPILYHDYEASNDIIHKSQTIHDGYEPLCPSCEIILKEHAPKEMTQEYPSTRIYVNREGQVVLDNDDDDLPF